MDICNFSGSLKQMGSVNKWGQLCKNGIRTRLENQELKVPILELKD